MVADALHRLVAKQGCWEIGFGQMSLTINEAHKQYSLLDTVFNCIVYLGPPGTYFQKIKETYYMSASFAGRHVVGFGDLSIDLFPGGPK